MLRVSGKNSIPTIPKIPENVKSQYILIPWLRQNPIITLMKVDATDATAADTPKLNPLAFKGKSSFWYRANTQ